MTGPSSGFGCRLQLLTVTAGGPAAAVGRGCCSGRVAVPADIEAMRCGGVAAAVAVPPESLPQCRRPLLSQSIRLPVVVHPPPGGCGIVAICGQDTSSSRSESDAHASSQFDPGPAVHGFCLPLPLYSCPPIRGPSSPGRRPSICSSVSAVISSLFSWCTAAASLPAAESTSWRSLPPLSLALHRLWDGPASAGDLSQLQRQWRLPDGSQRPAILLQAD